MSEISDKAIGKMIGKIISDLVDLIADIDGLTRDDVLEMLFTEWWKERITEE